MLLVLIWLTCRLLSLVHSPGWWLTYWREVLHGCSPAAKCSLGAGTASGQILGVLHGI
jgi:hypothetical protein